MRRARGTMGAGGMLLLLLVVQLLGWWGHVTLVAAQSDDYYCGTSWEHAAEICPLPCTSGSDAECASALGDDHGCFYFTGCAERVASGEFGTPAPTKSPSAGTVPPVNIPTYVPTGEPTEFVHTAFCAESWLEASLKCDDPDEPAKPCPIGDECLPREICAQDINCARPLVALEGELIISLDGVTQTAAQEDVATVEETVFEVLVDKLANLNVQLQAVEITSQRLGESFDYVDLTTQLTALYRPVDGESSVNLNKFGSEEINKSRMTILSRLKTGAIMSGSTYFTELDRIGVGLGRTKEPTLTPSGYPTGRPTTRGPTGKPTPPPTMRPTLTPTAFPSGMPSSTPSRSHLQSIVTHTRNEMLSMTDTTYGYLFNVRTAPDGPAITLTGFDFYTDQSGPVNYELWSKEGSFVGFRGEYQGWELLASGTVEGRGRGRYTSIPDEEFTEVSMPGGGGAEGTRAIYITLNTKDLVYRTPPVANPANTANEADMRAQWTGPELEVYEGEAVLSYPFPDPVQTYFYRPPQEFVGVVRYDRLPCRPFSRYGEVIELPCPVGDWPTESPTTARPSRSPVVRVPTASPVVVTSEPTGEVVPTTVVPSLSPVVEPTAFPTSFPTTILPTPAPIDVDRGYIVVTLHGSNRQAIMTLPELDAFTGLLTSFLNQKTSSRMVVQGVDVWSQDLVAVESGSGGDTAAVSVATATNAQVISKATEPLQRRMRRRVQAMAGPPASALQLSLAVRVSSSTLPEEELGNVAAETIDQNEVELLGRIKGLSGTFPFFADISGIDVTASAPFGKPSVVEAPPEINVTTSASEPNGPNEPEVVVTPDVAAAASEPEDESDGSNVGVIVGVVVGIFALCLAVAGFVFRRKFLRKVEARRQSEKAKDLLITDDPAEHTSSSRSIPMGDVTSVDGKSVDGESTASSNKRKAGKEKDGVSKSMTERAKSRVVEEGTARLNKSDVVTEEEKVSVRAAMREKKRSMRKKKDRPLERQGNEGKGTLKKSLVDMEWDEVMDELDDEVQEGLGMPDTSRRGNRRDRRSQLAKSDSRIVIDTSALTSRSNPRNNLSRSMVDTEFDEAMLDDNVESSAQAKRRRGKLRSSLRKSSTDRDVEESGDVRSSLRKSGTRRADASLRKSATRRPDAGLRESLVDLEFEGALMEDGLKSDGDLRSSLKRPAAQRDVKLRSSATKKRNERAFSQSMKVVRDLEGRQGAADNEDALKKSLTKRVGSSDLRRSDTRKARKNLSKSVKITKADFSMNVSSESDSDSSSSSSDSDSSSSSESESTDAEATRRKSSTRKKKKVKGGAKGSAAGRKRSGNRPLSKSVTASKLSSDQISSLVEDSPIDRKGGVDESTKRRARDASRQFSKSMTISTSKGIDDFATSNGDVGPSETHHDGEGPNLDAKKKKSAKKSKERKGKDANRRTKRSLEEKLQDLEASNGDAERPTRKKSGEAKAARKSNAKGGEEELQRLVTEARTQIGDIPRDRAVSFDGPTLSYRPVSKRAGRGLSQSMTVSAKGSTGADPSSLRRSASDVEQLRRTSDGVMQKRTRKGSADLRRSAKMERGIDEVDLLTDHVQQSRRTSDGVTQKRTRKGSADLRRSAKMERGIDDSAELRRSTRKDSSDLRRSAKIERGVDDSAQDVPRRKKRGSEDRAKRKGKRGSKSMDEPKRNEIV